MELDKYQRIDLLIKYAKLNLDFAVALKDGLSNYAGAEDEYRDTVISCMIKVEKELGIE